MHGWHRVFRKTAGAHWRSPSGRTHRLYRCHRAGHPWRGRTGCGCPANHWLRPVNGKTAGSANTVRPALWRGHWHLRNFRCHGHFFHTAANHRKRARHVDDSHWCRQPVHCSHGALPLVGGVDPYVCAAGRLVSRRFDSRCRSGGGRRQHHFT